MSGSGPSGVVTRHRNARGVDNSNNSNQNSNSNNAEVKQEPLSAGNSNRSTPQPGGGIKTEIKDEMDDK